MTQAIAFSKKQELWSSEAPELSEVNVAGREAPSTPATVPPEPPWSSETPLPAIFRTPKLDAVAVPEQAAINARNQKKLDDFHRSMNPTLHTRDGNITVPVNFRMATSKFPL